MPCSDSSSSMTLFLDAEELFIRSEYAKITCGQDISKGVNLSQYLKGKTLPQILSIPFAQIVEDLKLTDSESQFILYLEWDALRSAIGLYLGVEDKNIDLTRCQITSIEQNEKGMEVALVVLPPKELPKILPCSLADARSKT